MKDLIEYLDSNVFSYDVSELGVITIGGDTYELSLPNRDGFFFDRGFNYIGTQITANNYIYKFGQLYYTLKKGDESNVKLKLFKYVGKVDSEIPTLSFLGVHGPFELLNGTGNYNDWCLKAKFFGVEYLGICEKNTLAGVLKFQLACEKNGLKPVVGETVTVFSEKRDLMYDVKLYVENEIGWMNLLSINKEINVGDNLRVEEEKFLSLLDGLVVVIDPKSLKFEDIPASLSNACYQLDSVKFDSDGRDKAYLQNLQKYLSSKMVVTNICDAYYLDQEYSYLKRAVNSIGGVSNDLSRNQYFKCNEEYLMEIKDLFREEDGDSMFDLLELAIDNTNDIAKRCSSFKIEMNVKHLPKYKMTEEEFKKYGGSKKDMFIDLIGEGLMEMNIPEGDMDKYLERVEKEVGVIERGGTIDYFLILWDIVKWCKENNILVGFGRGSGGGSLCARAIGLTYIDPLKYDLLFERFLSEGRIGKQVDVNVIELNGEYEIEENKIVLIKRGEKELEVKGSELEEGDIILSDNVLYKIGNEINHDNN